ncbi:fibronectin type III domain-containing protein [Flavobacterium sp. DG1-102-2]|uniref:fibronectin type III domain-containing protein n=1 Tax=Flavobacterium sp. DG1-102-2 TaxID=3081663 RepID=UPI00294A63E0|nr:fibronectin type III domain-containing protein [Flavobacterium sp. DG1-102-2]MDV6167799.1 fibronectin type III domain-containing protein [Flavobacterium sp. DG1-102-2]
MKKITLMIVVSLMSFFAHAQLAVEHFDAAWTGTPAAPPDWKVINQYGPNVTWIQTIPGNLQQPPFGGDGHSAYLNKEAVAPGSAIPADWLVTKLFNVPANGELSFQSKLTINGDQGSIYKIYIAEYAAGSTPADVTVDNFAATANLLATYTELQINPDQAAWAEKTITLPAVWAGKNVRIAFMMTGLDKDRWFIDDVKVAAACVAPTNGVVVSKTINSANLSWTSTGVTSWDIEVVPAAATPTQTGVSYSGALPYVAGGLNACTDYKFYVRNNCGDSKSPWIGPVFFKTSCLGETCASPIVIPGGNYSTTDNTSNYSDFYEGIAGTGCNSTGNYLAGNDVVYAYTPTATGNFSITLTDTGGPAGMFIYSSCANIGSACIGGGTATATAPVNLASFAMTSGTTYYIVISTNGSPQTTGYKLTIQQVFCPQPTAGNATGVTGTSAILGWTPGTAGATSWQMAVQPQGAGLPSTGTVVSTSTGNTVTTTTAGAALVPATTYEFYVREACVGGNYSIWAGPFLFTTSQVPTALPFIQNFDGADTGGMTLANGTQVNKWFVGTAVSNSPTKSLYISNDNGVTNAYANGTTAYVHAYKTIQMPATVDQLSLSFDWRCFGESTYDFVKVWVVPDSFTPAPGTAIVAANGTEVGTFRNLSNNWQTSNNIITAPAAWAGTARKLVFEWTNDNSAGSNPPAAIDNIVFKVITCPQPTALTIGALTTAQAVINWTAPTTVTPPSYDVYVSQTPTAPTDATPVTQNVTGTSATISPLTASATYYVWVRSHCSDADKSFWTGAVSFNTPQVPAPMPYAQNFDSGAHSFTLSNGTQSNKWVVGTATSNSPASSLYVSADGTANSYNHVTSIIHAYRDIQLPATVTSGQLLLKFDWKSLGENNWDYMKVFIAPVTFSPTPGTIITPDATNGVVAVGANFQANANWTTSNNVVTSPAAWNNTVRRVIFQWQNDGGGGSPPPAAVDNIEFSVITCPAPSALVLNAVTINSATVSWTAPTAAPASYDYYISTTATPPTATTPVSGNVPGPTANIGGLTDSTNYNVWVRSNCGATDGTSFWIGPLNFNTPQIPAAMPYAQNFDGADNPGYTFTNGTQANKWAVGTAVSNSPTKSMYITNDNGVTNAYAHTTSVVQAYRDIQLPATIASGQILLNFDWKSVGEANWDYLKVFIAPTTFSPVSGTTITPSAANGVVAVGANYQVNGSWTTVNAVVPAPAAWNGTVRRVIFQWQNDGGGGTQPPVAVDNIGLSVVTCAAPTALVSGTIDAANATFSWTAPAPAPAGYDYFLTTSPIPPVAGTVPTGYVTNPTVTLSGLPDSTNYYIWVRSNCGGSDGTSFWIGPVNFNTPQIPATLPYVQNFDGAGNPAFTYTTGTQPNKWFVGGATFNSPSQSLYISSDNGVTHSYNNASASTVHAYRDIVIPAGVTNLDLSFDWKNVGEAADYLKVVMVPLSYNPVAGTAIPAGSSTAVTTANLFGSVNWQNASYAVPITAAQAGTTQRFVFQWVNNGFTGSTPAAVDNIDIKVLTCPKPTALTATGIGMTTATLGWTEAGTANAWEVYVVTTGSPAPGTDTVGTAAPTNGYPYGGLEPGTQYQYYVRSVCAPGDKSRWSGPFAFHTNVCEIVDQCNVNFILTDSGNNGWQGNTMSVTQSGILVGTLGPQLATGGGPVTVSLPLCKGIPYEVFWNPGGTNPNQTGLQIVNPFNGQTVYQRIGGTVSSDQNTILYTGLAICSTVTCPQPTNLVSQSVVNAPGTTELGWTPGGTETQWEVKVQTQGAGFPTAAPTGTTIVNENSLIVENLVPNTPYEYYVRSICSDTDKSYWSGPLKFSDFTPPACADVTVVDLDLEVIAPDTEYVICPGENLCVDFSASYYAAAAETTSYEVTSIPFSPPFPTLGGTSMPVGVDDIWGPKIVLPFEFCFMGDVYNAAQVGANGLVSFNADQPSGGPSGYAFSQTIPNATFPQRNAIYGVYQDTDPSITNAFAHPNINYQVLGNYPCRALVVSFNELAQFGGACNNNATIGAQSYQIVMYEITNIIEVYVKRRVPCTDWQSGVGLIGVQNAAGTVAFTPPGRNTGAWTATEEAWRFTPNGDTTATFEWLKDGQPFSTTPAIEVCALETGTTTMTARASYVLCNGNTIVRESNFAIRVQEQIIPANDPVNISKCGNGEDVSFDLNEAVANAFPADQMADYTFAFYATEQDAIDGGTNVLPAPFVTTATTTVWVRIMKAGQPCFITRSFQAIVSNVPPKFTVTADQSVCAGSPATITVTPDAGEDLSTATYEWTLNGDPIAQNTASITVTDQGTYAVTVSKGACIDTKSTTVTVVALPVADNPDDVVSCGPYTLPALSAGNTYYTGPGGTGTAYNGGDIIPAGAASTTQTMYVYAVSPTLAACTAENSFELTINPRPELDPITSVDACDSYVLPALPAGQSYYTGAGATGTALDAGDVVSTTQTIYVYEASATDCSAETSFVVTITASPVADAPGNETVCDSYVLPALSAGNSYFTATGGTGTPLSAGETITTSQRIYVYAVAAENAACTNENFFDVTIIPTPQFNLGGPYVSCLATNVTIQVGGANFDTATATYAWTVNGSPTGTNSSAITGTEFGTYEVTVTVGTCIHTESVVVTQDTTAIDLAFLDDCESNVYYVEVTDVDGSFDIDHATYLWTGPDGFTSTDRKMAPPAAGEYTVTITTDGGCVSTDTFEVLSTTCMIPRGISPNGDGKNDEFDLSALGVRKLEIFNRYGQEVYSKSNYTNEFIGRGSNGDELPTGTYFYMIERSNGESKTGWVYINREEK